MNTVHCKQRNTNRSSRAKGTALVLVVVLLALLAILGTTFVITSRIERVAAGNVVAAGELDQAIDSVVEVIKSTLAEDLWGRPEDATSNQSTTMNKLRLLGLPCADNGSTDVATASRYNNIAIHSNTHMYFVNEPWDAPWTQLNASPTVTTSFSYWDGTAWGTVNWAAEGDPWLASTEMNGGVWPRVSDIFRVRFTNAGGVDDWPIDFTNVPYVSLASATDDQKERYADADGDNYTDSVWLYQRGFFPEDPDTTYYTVTHADVDGDDNYTGLVTDLPLKSNDPNTTYRMAVRIVDTCGMVNVNTAWKRPTEPQEFTGDDFPGHLLSGVNLYDANLVGSDFSPLPGRPADNATLTNLASYQEKYIFRIEHPWGSNGLDIDNPPFSGFCPLDLSDEIALRTYPDTIDNTTLVGLFPALATTQALKPRLTTYSFSRNLRRTLATGNGALWDIDDTSGAGLQNVTGRTSANRNGFPRKKNLDLALKIWRDVGSSFGGGYRPRQVESLAEGYSTFNPATPLTADREFVASLYSAFYAGVRQLTTDPPADPVSYASRLSAQYLVNLLDYMDSDDNITYMDVAQINARCGAPVLPPWSVADYGPYVYGNEPHLVISEVYVYKDTDNNSNTRMFFSIEILNPWMQGKVLGGHGGGAGPGGSDYALVLLDATGQFKASMLLDKMPDIDPGGTYLVGSKDLPAHSDPEIQTPTMPSNAVTLSTAIADNDRIILVRLAGSGILIPVDRFDLPRLPGAPPTTGEAVVNFVEQSFQRYTWTDAEFTALDVPGPTGALCDWGALVDEQKTSTAHSGTYPGDNLTETTSVGGLNGGETNTAPLAPTRKFTIPYKRKTPSSPPPSLQQRILDETLLNFGEAGLVWCMGSTLRDLGGGLSKIVTPAQIIAPGGADSAATEQLVRPSFDHPFGQQLLEFFSLLGREDNGINEIGDTGADSLDELRLPGLININTAPAAVLQSLHPWITPAVAKAIDNQTDTNPFGSTTGLLTMTEFQKKPDNSTDPNPGVKGSLDNDTEKRQLIWSRIANLVTTRSDTFVAYILVEKLDRQGNVLNRRREMVLFDRSWCNQPPLVWNDEWVPNPNYVAPKVVARQVVE